MGSPYKNSQSNLMSFFKKAEDGNRLEVPVNKKPEPFNGARDWTKRESFGQEAPPELRENTISEPLPQAQEPVKLFRTPPRWDDPLREAREASRRKISAAMLEIRGYLEPLLNREVQANSLGIDLNLSLIELERLKHATSKLDQLVPPAFKNYDLAMPAKPAFGPSKEQLNEIEAMRRAMQRIQRAMTPHPTFNPGAKPT